MISNNRKAIEFYRNFSSVNLYFLCCQTDQEDFIQFFSYNFRFIIIIIIRQFIFRQTQRNCSANRRTYSDAVLDNELHLWHDRGRRLVDCI